MKGSLKRGRWVSVVDLRQVLTGVAIALLTSAVVGVGAFAYQRFNAWHDGAAQPAGAVARAREAKMVASLRPGGREDDLATRIGTPAVVVSQSHGLRRSVFLLKYSAILALSNAAGRVVLTSVTSLDTDFRPTFHMDDGSVLNMWASRIAEVQTTPEYAAGFAGANFAYYFEWTSGLSHATNYRQGLFGYSLVNPDQRDTTFDYFYPFWYAADRALSDAPPIDMGLPALPGDGATGTLARWL